ncbi:MAG: transglycosylase SLT domain-containing protein [Bacteroidales bacterium]|nr:transglycosylase SLT domain-containing protein [Bacteroidales bacterium]
MAWATQKGAHGLQHEINTWLAGFQESRLAAILYHKYFKSERTARWAASSYHSLTGGRISEYDELIRKYSPEIGWDWRLLASLIYQESGFRPDARSWAGAFGLMQLMPGTAELLGVDSLSPPEEQIKAGVELIKRIQRQFEPLVPDPEERIRFVLAAYNAGNAHVYDAIRLAEKYGADPAVWENSVDTFLLNKDNPKYYKDPVVRFGYCQCDEPYWFVIEIMERYQHYLNVVKQ